MATLDFKPFRFECTRCGKCCEQQHGGATLYIADLVRLADHFGLTPREFAQRYCTYREHELQTPQGRRTIPDLRLRADDDGRCVFLSGQSCSVHEVKPYLCAAAPFVFEIFSDPGAKRHLIEICDGYGQGPEHEREEFERWLEEESRQERADSAAYADGAARRYDLRPTGKLT